MHSHQSKINFEFEAGSLGSKIKFMAVVLFIVIFGLALVSAIGNVSDLKEDLKNSAIQEQVPKHSRMTAP